MKTVKFLIEAVYHRDKDCTLKLNNSGSNLSFISHYDLAKVSLSQLQNEDRIIIIIIPTLKNCCKEEKCV